MKGNRWKTLPRTTRTTSFRQPPVAARTTSKWESEGVYISIPMVQKFCQNISISRDKTKLYGVGGRVESWWVV
jgi:hypothetical protein